MKSLNKMAELANRFEHKLSKMAQDVQQTSQPKEAPDFFFGTGYGSKNFVDALGSLRMSGDTVVGDKSIAAILAECFNKQQANASVTVGVQVVPQRGAKWDLKITGPADVQQKLKAELDRQFQAVTGKTMQQAQMEADAAAKKAKQVEGDQKKVLKDIAV